MLLAVEPTDIPASAVDSVTAALLPAGVVAPPTTVELVARVPLVTVVPTVVLAPAPTPLLAPPSHQAPTPPSAPHSLQALRPPPPPPRRQVPSLRPPPPPRRSRLTALALAVRALLAKVQASVTAAASTDGAVAPPITAKRAARLALVLALKRHTRTSIL